MAEENEPNSAEATLLKAAARGKQCDFAGGKPVDISKGREWNAGRTVRANFLSKLCTGEIGAPRRVGVRLRGARITSGFELVFAILPHPVFLLDCYFEDGPATNLQNLQAPALALSGSRVPSLLLDNLQTQGDVYLDEGFTSNGEVSLIDARIGGEFRCSGGKFLNSNGNALIADRLRAEGSISLSDGFLARGTVSLTASKIGGSLYCRKGRFEKPREIALGLDRATIEGNLTLDEGFVSEGEVRLLGAQIKGQLSCRNGTLEKGNGATSLVADGATVGRDVLLDKGFNADGKGFNADGLVRLFGASIGGALSCDGGSFDGSPQALDLERFETPGLFIWEPTTTPNGLIRLTDAHVGELRSGLNLWPEGPTKLDVDGFSYGTWESASSVHDRLKWLHQYCSGEKYTPQPYEQLADTYRKAGQDADARVVAIGKEHARRATLSRWRQPWHWLFGLFVGYGHRLGRALAALIIGITIGATVFAHAHAHCGNYQATRCGMQPTVAATELPEFQSIVFTTDTVLPIIDLHQEEYWVPERGYRWAFWFLIAAGWVLTTSVVAGLSRVLSRG